MISITVELDDQIKVRALTVKDHGESRVCAAVSFMVTNTVNSIECLTVSPVFYEYKEEKPWGYIRFWLPDTIDHDAELLLDAMMLGLNMLQEKHPLEIVITERKWQNDTHKS